MNIRFIENCSVKIAVAESSNVIIKTAQDALDLIATLRYEHECEKMIVYKECIAEEFFDLKTGVAGEVLQKYTNYKVRLAIVGDFSAYKSKALKDFIYECNKGNAIYFMPDEAKAIKALQH